MAEAPTQGLSCLRDTPGVQKELWESRYQWLCRRKFIEDHKNLYSPERVVCLSMVWANVNFLSSNYSEPVQRQVEYYPVPEKNELERWLTVHKEIQEEEKYQRGVREEEMKISSKRTLGGSPPSNPSKRPNTDHTHHTTPDLSQHLGAFITEMRNQKDNSGRHDQSHASKSLTLVDEETKSNPKWKKVIKLLSCWCMCPSCFAGESSAISRLYALCGKSKIILEYKYNEISESEKFIEIIIDGVCMSGKSGPSKREAKVAASNALMNEVQLHQEKIGFECPATGRRVVGVADIANAPPRDERIPEDNTGHQMLLKMGWSGEGGLGTHGQGNQAPVPVTLRSQWDREGLGGREGQGGVAQSNPNSIRNMLQDFIISDEMQLEFTPELSNEDRKTVHTLAEQLNLVHKSHGAGPNRFLVVSKKQGFQYGNEASGMGPGPIRHGNEASNNRQWSKPYNKY